MILIPNLTLSPGSPPSAGESGALDGRRQPCGLEAPSRRGSLPPGREVVGSGGRLGGGRLAVVRPPKASPATTAVLLTMTAGLPTTTAELPAMTARLPATTARLPATTAGLTTMTAGLPATTAGLSATTAGLPTMTAGLPATTAGLTAMTARLTATTAGLTARTARLTARTARLTARTVGLTARTVGRVRVPRGAPLLASPLTQPPPAQGEGTRGETLPRIREAGLPRTEPARVSA